MTVHHDSPQVPQEGEHVNFKKVILVGALSLLVFALGTVWSIRIQKDEESHIARTVVALPRPADTQEVGIVNTRMFEQDRRASQKHEALRQRLTTYGWVDREKRIIHIPIDRAIEQYVSKGGEK